MANFLALCLMALTFCQITLASPLDAKVNEQIEFVNAGLDFPYGENEDQPVLDFTDVTEVTNTGVWITYSGPNYDYDHDTPGAMDIIEIFPISADNTRPPFHNVVRSTRYVGVPAAEFNIDSVTFFDNTTLRGNKVTFPDELDEIDFRIWSIVTIGMDSVTLFENDGFAGEEVCIQIDPFYCQIVATEVTCWLWTLFTSDIPWGTAPRSARAGCAPTAPVRKVPANRHAGPATVMTA